MDCSLPGSSVCGISQARILEWVAISFSVGSFQLRDRTHVSCIGSGFFTTESPGKPQRGSEKWERKSLSPVATPWTVSPGNSPGQNTGVGSLSLLQEIFPTQGLNPGLPHCRHIIYQLSHKGSPWILEWVVYPFSSGSSRPRNWTRVSCIAGRFWEGDSLQNLLTKADFS